MHYYKRNIGDYHKKAGRLSMLQHGAYTLLLDSCYDREQFPTIEEAIEWTWASTTEEEESVKFVLGRFFVPDDDGRYVQKRIAEEINAFKTIELKNRLVALEREARRKSREKDAEAYKQLRDEIANGSCVKTHAAWLSVVDALIKQHETPPNQEPRTKNQEPIINTSPNGEESPAKTGAAPDCPHQEIINLYHEQLPMCATVRSWTDKRKAHLRARWREDKTRQDLEWWKEFFAYVAKSNFLTGRVQGRNGGKAFMADLEWLINSTNIVKVIEGKYENDGVCK